jgi:hypothetical protein
MNIHNAYTDFNDSERGQDTASPFKADEKIF